MKFLYLAIVFLVAANQAEGFQVRLNIRAGDLQEFGQQVKTLMDSWYPRIRNLLWSASFREVEYVEVIFDPNYNGVCGASGTRITCNEQWVRQRKDLGTFIHELAHHVQQYQNCESWITDGIADWVNHYNFNQGQWTPPGKPRPGQHYTNSYAVAAYFLKWIQDRKNGNAIRTINAACRDGSYNRNIFGRLTGRNVDQLWDEMMRS